MLQHHRIAGLILIGACAVLALAQPPQRPYSPERFPSDVDDEAPLDTFRKAERVPEEGFFPSKKQILLIIDRITEDMGKRYGFDEDQLDRTRQIIREQVPEWVDRNKAELKTLSNQWMDAMLSGAPPSTEYVAGWATRAQPLMQEFGGLMEKSTGKMREFMTEDQQILLDGEMAAFRVGMNFVTQKMNAWGEGNFNPDTDWPGGKAHIETEKKTAEEIEREMENEKNKAMGADAPVATADAANAPEATEPTTGRPRPQPPAAPGKPTGPKVITDEWERYTEDFITRYQLDSEQSTKARQQLKVAQENRDEYMRGRGKELPGAEKELAAAVKDEDKTAAKARVDRLKKPVETYFTQLKERLDKLPTRQQRAKATKSEPAAVVPPPPAQPAQPVRAETQPAEKTAAR